MESYGSIFHFSYTIISYFSLVKSKDLLTHTLFVLALIRRISGEMIRCQINERIVGSTVLCTVLSFLFMIRKSIYNLKSFGELYVHCTLYTVHCTLYNIVLILS